MDKILSESEVGALLKLVGSEDAASLTPAELAEHAQPYDFRQKSQLGPESKALLHEALTRAATTIGASLSRQLREPLVVAAGPCAPVSAGEFLGGSAEGLVFALDVGPGNGKALLALPRGFAARAVDRMLGGTGDLPPASRAPTRAELALAQRLVQAVLAPIRAALGESAALTLSAAHFVKNPQLPPVLDPAEGLVVQELTVGVGEAQHPLRFALTARSLGSGRLPGVSGAEEPAARPSTLEPDSPFGQLPLKVSAILGESQISIRALLDLEVGDVLCLGTQLDDSLEVRVSGVPKFRGNAGVHAGRVVVKVTDCGAELAAAGAARSAASL